MNNEILYSTKFLQLKNYKRENGHNWVYAHRPNAKDIVIIVPILKTNDEDKILFLITKRPPIYGENKGEFCLELPAGLVGDFNNNENIEEAIKRELKEETGFLANKIEIKTRKLASSAGLTSETSTIALAHLGKQEAPQDDDGGIIIERKFIKKSEVLNFIKEFEKQGNSIGAQTLSGLFYYFFE